MRWQCCLAVLVLVVSGVAVAQESEFKLDAAQTLDAAKLRYKRDLTNINDILLGLFDTEIEKIAEKGDLKGVRALQLQKDAFKADGTFPNLAAMQPHIVKYVEARKRLAAALTKAFDTAVVDLTKERKFDEAEAAETEGAKFAAEEKALLSGNRKAKADTPEEETDDKEPARFAGRKSLRAETFLPTWSKQFTAAVDKIAKLDTSTQRDKAHRELIQKTDNDLRTSQLTVTMTIKDVRFHSGKHHLDFESIEYATDIESLATFIEELFTTEITKEQALKLKPGDKCILTGSMRFGLEDYRYSDRLTLLTISHRTPTPYVLWLTNCKIAFQYK